MTTRVRAHKKIGRRTIVNRRFDSTKRNDGCEKIGLLSCAVYRTRVHVFPLICFIIFRVLYRQNRFRPSTIRRAPVSSRTPSYRPWFSSAARLSPRPSDFVRLSHITLTRRALFAVYAFWPIDPCISLRTIRSFSIAIVDTVVPDFRTLSSART